VKASATEVAALIKRTRTDRGLPAKVVDPIALARVAGLLTLPIETAAS